MELVKLETSEEHQAVKGFLRNHKDMLTSTIHVDGGSSTKGGVRPDRVDWFFEDGKRIPAMDWYGVKPNSKYEKCLSLTKIRDLYSYNDVYCSNSSPKESFICQELTVF
jgi:hypothetical protein